MSNHLHNFRLSTHISSHVLILVRLLLIYDLYSHLQNKRERVIHRQLTALNKAYTFDLHCNPDALPLSYRRLEINFAEVLLF